MNGKAKMQGGSVARNFINERYEVISYFKLDFFVSFFHQGKNESIQYLVNNMLHYRYSKIYIENHIILEDNNQNIRLKRI